MSTPPPVDRPKNLLPARRRAEAVGKVVGAFESETAAVILKTSPERQEILLYAVGIGLFICILLSSVVKIDRVVVGVGRTVPIGGSLYVSPLDSGIVREVRVKAGDIVRKGQVLATLDSTFTEADRTQLQQRFNSDQAAVSRLEAESTGRSYVPPIRDVYTGLQSSIYSQHLAEKASNLADFDARIRASEAQIAQYDSDTKQYSQRLQLSEKVEQTYGPLAEKGYVSSLQVLQAKDQRTEAARFLADAQGMAAAARQSLQALKSQREAYIQKRLADLGAELVATRNDLDATRQSLNKATRMNELITLDAPADAVVLKVGKVSSGSVAANGSISSQSEALFTLVPLDAPVEVDLRIPAAEIGFIKKGDSVQIKLDAYRFTQHGTARGKITNISDGSFTVTDDNQVVEPYFRVRVAITEAELRNVPSDFKLISGMTLQGDIMVGSRTILSYLIEGALRTGSEAMREPQ
jgi:HlyD family type I secretion membrane fusion protein